MNKEKITIKIADQTGFRINESDICTGKIVVNGVEVTDTESWNKAISTFTELEYQLEEKDKEIERLNNIIDTILDFPFFKEECPLNFGFNEKELETKAQDVFYEDEWCEKNCDDNYKKCWLKYFDKLKELKEENLKECITCGHKDIEENMYETQDGCYCDACKD